MTRKQALAAGIQHYDEGRMCLNGHTPVLRYASDGNCVVCKKTKSVTNSAAIVAKVAAWKAANPEKLAANSARYREKHQATLRLKSIIYRQDNPIDPMLRRIREARRRARKLKGGGSYTKEDVVALLRRQKGRCSYCQRNITKQYAVDHIVPLRLGGSSNRCNLQLLCRTCNSSKGGKHPIDFARRLGRLL